MTCDKYLDLVAAHVDGTLTEREAGEVEDHLRDCDRCRHLFEEEARFHAAFVARQLLLPVPIDVEQRLRQRLEVEGEASRSLWVRLGAWFVPLPAFPRLAVALAVAATLTVMLLSHLFRSAPAPDIFAQAVQYYQAVTAGALPLEYAVEDPQELQTRLNTSARLNFTTRVVDLRPYRLRGGKIVETAGHPLAVALYEEEGETPIVCLRQRGPLPPLPQGTAGSNGHYWYTADGYTAVFTQFPDHFCIMISRQPQDIFLQRLAAASGS
jgi:anti-sigma factor RsiW